MAAGYVYFSIALILLNCQCLTKSQFSEFKRTPYSDWLMQQMNQKLEVIAAKQSSWGNLSFNFANMQMVKQVTISTDGSLSSNTCSQNSNLCLPSGGLVLSADNADRSSTSCRGRDQQCPPEPPILPAIRPFGKFKNCFISFFVKQRGQEPTTLDESIPECGIYLPVEEGNIRFTAPDLTDIRRRRSCDFVSNPYISLDLNKITNYTLFFKVENNMSANG